MYKKSVKVSIVLVYMVIIAGAVVRMTGSGMGCPDWPKCFGHFVPPTSVEELQFAPETDYKKGQIIIVDESLKVAQTSFTSADAYNPDNWDTYTKHDYAEFNPAHTWIEYINRLFGALAGLAVFIMALFSFNKWKENKQITILSWGSVFLMGFQAWLGATVVYSVLSPVKITVHMVVALLIVAVLLYLLFMVSKITADKSKTALFQNLLILSTVATLVQIVLGTQVRQFVDEQIKLLGAEASSSWLANPDTTFYIHRSFSIMVLGLNVILWWMNKKLMLNFRLLNWVLALLLLEVITGIAMYNFDFPFGSQSLHLVIAAILFGVQFYLLLQCIWVGKKAETSYI